MLNGAFALLERSLRVDSRAWSTHLTRFGLMGAIYFSLCYALLTSSMFGSPGLRFFEGIAYLDATFMTLLGVSYFSTSITEEKEEDTLGLMLMAGISPLGILAGKSGGRLWQSLLLVAVQYPFVQLAVTMGGIMGTQIWSVTVALLAYMVFLAGFGLLCSTLAPRGQIASGWMIAGLVIYFVVPGFAKHWTISHAAWIMSQGNSQDWRTLTAKLIDAVGELCIYIRLNSILTTGNNDSALSLQVVTNVLAGIGCAGLAWLLFGVATRSPSTESSSRGLVARRRGFFQFSAQRCWDNPFVWKDFHFVTGGVGMLVVRIAYYMILGLLIVFLEDDAMRGLNYAGFWWGLSIFMTWFSVVIDAARVHSRSLQEEVRGQTLASLMMLPRSSVGIVYSKCVGTLVGWFPGLLISLTFVFISPELRKGMWQMFRESQGPLVLCAMILYFSLIPHFAALLSLYVRWGAVALAIGLTIGVYFGMIMVFSMGMMLFMFLFPGRGGGQFVGPELVIASVSFFFFCICVACHIGINLRVQALGAK